MDNYEINVDITKEQLEASISRVNQALRTVEKHARKAQDEIRGIASKNVQKSLDRTRKGLKDTANDLDKTGQKAKNAAKDGKKFSNMLQEWWRRFGLVAVAFTVVYRAMNALENIISKVTETIKTAIQETGELASLQAKLAMFTKMAYGEAVSFNDAYKDAALTVQGLADASATAISSLGEISIAADEMAQHGVRISKDMAKPFTDFVDFTILIAKTTGDNAKQIRSELNALMEGQMRANNVLIRALVQFGILNDAQLAQIRSMTNRSEIANKVISEISKHWERVRDVIISNDITIALDVWNKRMRRMITMGQQLASRMAGVGDILADTVAKHIEGLDWNKLSDDMKRRFISLIFTIRDGLEIALTAFERIVVGVTYLNTAFVNLKPEIKATYEILKGLFQFFIAARIISAFARGIAAAATAMRALATASWSLKAATTPKFVMLAVAAFFALSAAIETVIQKLDEIDIAGKIREIKEAAVETVPGLGKAIEIWKKADELDRRLTGKIGKTIGGWLSKAPTSPREEAYGVQYPKKDLSEAFKAPSDKSALDLMFPSQTAIFDWLKGSGKEAGKVWYGNFKDQLKAVSTFITNFLKDAFGDIFKQEPFDIPSMDFEPVDLGKLDEAEKKVKKLEDLLKKIGNITTSFRRELEKAVKAGDVNLVEKLVPLARREMMVEYREAKDRVLDLYEALRLATDPKVVERLLLSLEQTKIKIKELEDGFDNLTIADQTILAKTGQWTKEYEKKLKNLESLYGEGTNKFAREANKLSEEYLKKINSLPEATSEAARKAIELLREVIETFEEKGWLQRLKEDLNDYFDEIGYSVESVGKTIKNSFKSAEDAIVEFAKTGKFEFKELIGSILEDLLRLQIQETFKLLFAEKGSTGKGLLQTFIGSLASGIAGNFLPNLDFGSVPILAEASGGIIPEPVYGIGRSGTRYTFGEEGPETVTAGAGGGQPSVINNFYVDTMDAMSFAQYARKNRKIFGQTVTEDYRRKGISRRGLRG